MIGVTPTRTALTQRPRRADRIGKEPLIFIVVLVAIWLVTDAALSLDPRCYDIANFARNAGECHPFLPGPLTIGTRLWLGENRDFVVALAAVVIALFTIALYGATRGLWRAANAQRSDLEAAIQAFRDTAAAAAKSADVVILLERSWLFIDRYRLTSDDGYATPNSWTVVLRWRNVGRAPAIVEEFVLKISDIDALAPTPDYSSAGLLVCHAHAVAPGQTFVTQRVGPSPAIAMKDGKAVHFVLFGRITYRQLSGARHVTGFAMSVSPHAPTASVLRNDAYNYWN